MDEENYTLLKELLEQRYRKKRESLEAEYKRDLSDLERIFNRVRDTDPDDATSAMFVRPAATLIEAVKSVIADIGKANFDINTVIGLIEKKHPEIKTPINPTSVSGILRKLLKQKELKIVKEGSGTRPTIYCVLKSE